MDSSRPRWTRLDYIDIKCPLLTRISMTPDTDPTLSFKLTKYSVKCVLLYINKYFNPNQYFTADVVTFTFSIMLSRALLRDYDF